MTRDPQYFLDKTVASDKCKFLDNIGAWSNHRPMLLLALNLTSGIVIEYGSGDGSTPYLSTYCNMNEREFYSYDNNLQWCNKTGSQFIENWDKAIIWQPCSVAFIDHAPGEHRHIAIARMADKADIIVVHDSEEGGAGNYMLHKIWKLFKYRLNYNKTGGGAGATALSNTIDLHKYRGLSLGEFTFDND